ncbi:hypothetical protein RUM43_001340 [Polyplax serrata]|uniref:receptor protein-tyrosine kinase n=1 Tax=Polyplax serrata TaxID=468196 RepID=A0AAN8SF73_POLSC
MSDEENGEDYDRPDGNDSTNADGTAKSGADRKNGRKSSRTPPPSPRRATEEAAMQLPPKMIIEKLESCYGKFVVLRVEVRDLEREFGKLDRKRNRRKATEEELQLRLQKKKQLKKKCAEFNLLSLKILKLQEAAQAKDIKPSDMPPEPPPLEDDDEDECLPDDILPRVIVCGTDRNGKMADVPKIVVCIEDSCKKPIPEKELEEEEQQQQQPEEEAFEEGGKEGAVVVAVKTLKESAGEKERKDLVQELEVMKTLEPHPNIVRLLGCCTEKDPLFVIMEFVAKGKLQSYLRNSRAERCYGNMHGESKTLTSRDLTGFAYQCARGMEFLSSKGIIHRDLAARNILVSNENICKVADFGFARDIIGSHVYERKSEGRLPIRWMAPESLYDNIFSVKSDVWSFGVLIWEIVTLGSTPYPGLAAADVMRKVRDGCRLEKPDHCRRELYNIMYYCWDKDPKERPSFQELVTLLEQLLLSETDYIELDRFPDHSYYNMVSLSGEKL